MPDTRPRLIVLADMDNEPDEEQQMLHLLVCSNKIAVDGLIAVTGKYLTRKPVPALFHKLIDAYAMVYPNLCQHAKGFHTPAYLHGVTAPGQPEYGMGDVGDGKRSAGSDIVLEAILRDDPRPVNVVVNAGSNTLAQALWDLRANYDADTVNRAIAQLRVFENGAQDNAGAWACHEFPALHWMRSNFQTYAWGGPAFDVGPEQWGPDEILGPNTWEPYEYSPAGQHFWTIKHIVADHGELGMLYPLRSFHDGRLAYIEGGGTTPWQGLLYPGLYTPDEPAWGGPSGRFTREKQVNYMSRHADVRADEETVAPFSVYAEVADRWTNPETGKVWEGIFVPVWRWRRAMFNDFRCRMDWCVADVADANHHPTAAINGDASETIARMSAAAGESLALDATASTDPDSDPLAFRWFVYPEAGTYDGEVTLADADQAVASVVIPEDASGMQIHVILEVHDTGREADLYAYKRLVIDVR